MRQVVYNPKSNVVITGKAALILFGLSSSYLLLSWVLVGFKPDQLVLIGIVNICFYLSALTRKFIIGFSIFLVYWIVFDYMKAFPNYNYNQVHISGLYNLEKDIFGIHSNGELLTPNEYWRAHSNTVLDLICGFFYLCWIPVPLAFAGYLFFKSRAEFLQFSLTFVLVNVIGFVIYYLFPAAPPWYVHEHGFKFIAHTTASVAGLAQFDRYFHITLFASIYAKGSNVFAAMPSLHSAYPMIVLYYAIRNKLGFVIVFFYTVMLGIWFAAVYLSHHYVLDVLAGITCATAGILLFNYVFAVSYRAKRFLASYTKLIT
jgi:hypothetical protein